MMKIDSEFLKLQLEYSRWANERTLTAVRECSHEELTRDLRNSYGGVLGTVRHIFESDRLWLSRLQGTPRTTLADDDEVWTLDSLDVAWTLVAEGFRKWAYGVEDAERVLSYHNLAGKPFALPYWQVILHVVNHGTYHRGQVTTMLRQLRVPPVATDLHLFYLSRQ